ncbi:hypothetical protein [Desulfogranum japonicum]|uniref:hypothetical protein n=1 Tax=Desulfogranum japonicum TaxID=231447 RepID=UPI00040E99E6|nr:hypothetical protein [Desulfogranum japonicum]
MVCCRRVVTTLISLLILLLLPSVPLAMEIPEQLEPWVPWVLHDQEDRFCTSSFDGKQRFCMWPGPLDLEVHDTGGHFSQIWEMKREGWIVLPGDEKLWPQRVTMNAESVAVINKDDQPAIHIETAGQYLIKGEFAWSHLPESLSLPAGTGIIRLQVNGEERPADISNTILWIANRSGEQNMEMEDTVHTQVYRLLTDSTPMMITNRIEVQVSGKSREILVDWQVPADQIPVSLECALPVKIDTDNRIHLQARPGNHIITYRSRLPGPVNSLTFSESAMGPETEYWSFESQNQLRMVKISGDPTAVDPGQTPLPHAWHEFPAYRIKKGQTLQFETLKRGNLEPPPNDLTLYRTFWLDGDGSGMTVQDILTGTVHREPRLEMQPPATLGRMVINGRDQLITRVNERSPAGVEVRQGKINAMAVSRLETTRSFPAGGWNQSVAKLSGELVLPPGWTLLHAGGIDRVKTWLTRWTLLDCFIVLIIVISSFKLLGVIQGSISLVALVLTYHDPAAPVFMWLVILACIALIQALPESKYIYLVKKGKLVLLVGLTIMVLPYSVEQLRVGLYPQLEQVYNPYIPPMEAVADGENIVAPQRMREEVQLQSSVKTLSKRASIPDGKPYASGQDSQQFFDTQAKVQAGPGLPSKKWRIIRLSWNGPVEKELQINLLLISPFFNLVLAGIKVATIFLLAFFMAGINAGRHFRFLSRKTLVAILFTAMPLAMMVSPGYCADYPEQQLLNELRERLLKPAQCFPNCADLETMQVELEGSDIQLVINSAAIVDCAIQLPSGKGALWHEIQVNGSPAPVIDKDKGLWLSIPKGQHHITMTGSVNSSNFQLQLPHKPHKVTFIGHDEWSVAGLDNNNVPEDRLQFIRQEQEQLLKGFAASTLPPLMQVERVLHLGLQWRLETIVTRLSPPGSSVFMEIPLLSGESVINAEYKVEDGMIKLPFGPNEQSKHFQSVFKEQHRITLTAPDTTAWYEIWRLNASPVWHVESTGLAPILHHSMEDIWQPEWHPWPTESLILEITRPQGIPGPTKAIESSMLSIEPGLRSTTMHLTFTIRSTRGDQQTVILPQDATIQSVHINGKDQPVKKGNTVVIPLNPSNQRVEIQWRTPQGISSLYTVPEIDLGSESVNAEIEIQIGNRWVWFVSGPQMGPAILFYSELLILVFVALALGWSRLTPLKHYQWLILGLGLCQSGLIPGLIIVGWFVALKLRETRGEKLSGHWFNLAQTMLVLLTIVAMAALTFAVQNGLLGHPDMLIAGNNSTSYLLRWYQDRVIQSLLPQPTIVSIPILVYRLAMLIWALWLAFHLLRWIRWGWGCFTTHCIWSTKRSTIPTAKSPEKDKKTT